MAVTKQSESCVEHVGVVAEYAAFGRQALLGEYSIVMQASLANVQILIKAHGRRTGQFPVRRPIVAGLS